MVPTTEDPTDRPGPPPYGPPSPGRGAGRLAARVVPRRPAADAVAGPWLAGTGSG